MAGRPGRSPGAPTTERGSALSARQTEILGLIAHGRSNREIARQLGLTEGTVKQHIYALYRKLQVRNRTQALREGARWLGRGTAPVVGSPAQQQRATTFARRLVTAVVLLPRPDAPARASDAPRLEETLSASSAALESLVVAFDATPERLTGGGLAAWFGQPQAHGDDVARAVAFVRALGEARLDASPVAWTVGIATAAEILGEDGRSSPAFHTLRTATLFATLAQPGEPLVCVVSAAIALGAGAAAPSPSLPEGAVRLMPSAPPSVAIAQKWGGLPFCGELVAAAQRRRIQWLAVESWPPEAGTRLLAAIGEYMAARGVRVQTLWAPVRSRASGAARALLGQLSVTALPQAEVPGEALVQALLGLPDRRISLLVVHGMDALESLKIALGEEGLRRLREAPMIIAAGAMQRGDGARTTVRLLGSSPAESPFVRVLRMEVPSLEEGLPDLGVRPDVQALLDSVSAAARRVARAASQPGMGTLEAVARALAMKPGEVRERCAELGRYGVLRLEGDALVFRDEITAAAVRASLS